MNTSIIQLQANQNNAQKSTNPVTAEGKQIVANNAVKHGIFSRHLILSDENPEDYQLLLDGLQTELNPIGTLEQSLVERIAVTLWRQKRLVRSETAISLTVLLPLTASSATLVFCVLVINVRFFHSFSPTFSMIDTILNYCPDFGVHYSCCWTGTLVFTFSPTKPAAT
jgi:hypothetical protein